MGEFFKGWRRKMGCVTLVMASVFMVGWVRSMNILDSVSLPVGRHRLMQLWSGHQSMTGVNEYHANIDVTWDHLGWGSVRVEESDFDDIRMRWLWKWCGFGIADGIDYPVMPRSFRSAAILTVPYCALTTPLTLLSAFLLLSKPRPSNQKKISELTANEGGVNHG